jgi:hypothetical protein
MTDLEYLELAIYRAKDKLKPLGTNKDEINEEALIAFNIFDMLASELCEINRSLREYKE